MGFHSPCPPTETPTDPFWASFHRDEIGSLPPHLHTPTPQLPLPGRPHPLPGSKCPSTGGLSSSPTLLPRSPPLGPGVPPSSQHAGDSAPLPQASPLGRGAPVPHPLPVVLSLKKLEFFFDAVADLQDRELEGLAGLKRGLGNEMGNVAISLRESHSSVDLFLSSGLSKIC